jgi:anti-sigma regulatory factor (Ser/Thr protein kinase)
MTQFSKKDTSNLVLAVDEACANILRHNYRGKTDGVIILECRFKKKNLEFVLKDKGFPMDCKKIQHRPLDEVRPGGLGVFFIKKMMDKVAYRRSKAWNIVTMVKYAKKK